jgi:hypothetical protein
MNGPAGWFPDPSGAPGQRYFDGTAWTQHFAPHVSTAPAPTVAVAVANGGGSNGGMHVVHLLLTLLTCGMWLPIWIICAIIEAVGGSGRSSTAVAVGTPVPSPVYGSPGAPPSPVVVQSSGSNAGKIVLFIVAGIFSLFFGMVLLGLIIEHPWLLFAIVPAFVAAAALYWRHRDNKLQVFERYRRDVLAHRADTEHNLAQQGDPRGTYGDFPPPPQEDLK